MVRALAAADIEAWATLRARLWPDADARTLERECRSFADGYPLPNVTAVFLAEDEASIPLGFLELSVRAFADGCDSMPVPHIEGLYVEPIARRKGFGEALIRAAEKWAQDKGFIEIASDTEVENGASRRFHAACGFTEVEIAVRFRKALA